jgi:hypothetical protein
MHTSLYSKEPVQVSYNWLIMEQTWLGSQQIPWFWLPFVLSEILYYILGNYYNSEITMYLNFFKFLYSNLHHQKIGTANSPPHSQD